MLLNVHRNFADPLSAKVRLPEEAMMADKARILFVDDEQHVLFPLRALFKKHYLVSTATSGSEALAIMEQQPVQVIISDQRMPEMSGIELLRQVKQRSPDTVRILLTGYADLEATLAAVNSGEVFRFIEKPWNNHHLKQVVESAVRISAQGAATVPEWDAAAEMAQSDTPALLVAGNDPQVYAEMQRLFGSHYPVLDVRTLDRALEFLENRAIAVLVTDAIVGQEEITPLVHVLKEHYPSIISVVITRRVDAHLLIRLINHGQIFRYLTKPVEAHALQRTVQTALKRYAILQARPDLWVGQSVEKLPENDEESAKSDDYDKAVGVVEKSQDQPIKTSTLRNRLQSLRRRTGRFFRHHWPFGEIK